MRLLRQEFYKSGNFSESVEEILSLDNESITLVNGQNGSFYFRDTNTVLGRKYRYFVAYRVGTTGLTSRGEELISDEDETIIRRFYIDEIPFAITTTDAVASQDGDNNTVVSFDILAEATQDFFRTVFAALRDAGVDAQFIAALQKDNLKAKLFTMFLVERVDLSTGRRVSFGIFPAGRFIDSPDTRLPRGIPPPASGVRYEYVVKTCLQQPDVFLQASSVGLIDRFGNEIQRKASRFARAMYSRMGVLPPDADVRYGKSIEDLVLETQVGQEQVLSIKIPVTSPVIETPTVTEKSFYSSLTWRVSGDVRNVSYFLVYCTYNGRREFLGTIACSRGASLYRYRDHRFYEEVGQKSYHVQAVNFDDDVTVQSASVSIDRLYSVPENLLVGTAFSSEKGKKHVQTIGGGASFQNPLVTQQSTKNSSNFWAWSGMEEKEATKTASKLQHAKIHEAESNSWIFWSNIDLPVFSGKGGYNKLTRMEQVDQKALEPPGLLFSALGFKDLDSTTQKFSDRNAATATGIDKATLYTAIASAGGQVSADGNIESFESSATVGTTDSIFG
jgi:hypothetical protein